MDDLSSGDELLGVSTFDLRINEFRAAGIEYGVEQPELKGKKMIVNVGARQKRYFMSIGRMDLIIRG